MVLVLTLIEMLLTGGAKPGSFGHSFPDSLFSSEYRPLAVFCGERGGSSADGKTMAGSDV